MGVNAQTTVPTFTASQILTADQMNQSARTGVPVFADATARDAAFGGTGEKVLAEGQLCYLESTNVVQYYDGAAWATVGPTTPGLVRLVGETAFSAVASVTVDNVFSATYRNYKIFVTYVAASGTNIALRVRAGGSSVSTTTYNIQALLAGSTTVSATRGASSQQFSAFLASGFAAAGEMTVYQPFIAAPTNFAVYTSVNDTALTAPDLSLRTGNNSNSTSYDGFELFVASGTMTGHYAVYGLATA